MFNSPVNFEQMTPKKLYSDDSSEKVLAIIELITNPDKAQRQLEKVRELIAQNEAVLEEIKQGQEIGGMHNEAEIRLKESFVKAEQADTVLENAKYEANVIISQADVAAENTRANAARYAKKVKEEAEYIEQREKELEALIKKADREASKAERTRKALEKSKKEYETKLDLLKQRFEGIAEVDVNL